MGENVVFLIIFDTCDVMYYWSISLLPPIVLYLVEIIAKGAEETGTRDSYGLQFVIFLGKTFSRIKSYNFVSVTKKELCFSTFSTVFTL